mgnify:CR=1 FL=1
MSFHADAVRAFEHAGWEQAAAGYESAFGTATRQFLPALIEAAGIGRGDRLLDLACGTGLAAAAAAERGAEVTGLDFSAAMLAEARAHYSSLRFEQGDAEALPFADGAFDVVVSNFGIHHTPNPAAALKEAYRVLRPGGRIAFTIWAAPAENLAWRLLFDAVARCGNPAASDAPRPGGGFATADHCRVALADAGFEAPATQLVRARWLHADGASLVAALRGGTARMAALIKAQDPAALPAIAADIDAHAAEWRGAGGLSLPIAAVVGSGRRPET